ncbi:hypothetical protein IID22_03700 [Patescibacteria group bacterium]|nr:hypothetical protein [Patescibacteria group bacterium]
MAETVENIKSERVKKLLSWHHTAQKYALGAETCKEGGGVLIHLQKETVLSITAILHTLMP